jgi:hypothetical protein
VAEDRGARGVAVIHQDWLDMGVPLENADEFRAAVTAMADDACLKGHD